MPLPVTDQTERSIVEPPICGLDSRYSHKLVQQGNQRRTEQQKWKKKQYQQWNIIKQKVETKEQFTKQREEVQ